MQVACGRCRGTPSTPPPPGTGLNSNTLRCLAEPDYTSSNFVDILANGRPIWQVVSVWQLIIYLVHNTMNVYQHCVSHEATIVQSISKWVCNPGTIKKMVRFERVPTSNFMYIWRVSKLKWSQRRHRNVSNLTLGWHVSALLVPLVHIETMKAFLYLNWWQGV